MLIWISKAKQVTEGHNIVEHEWAGAQFCPFYIYIVPIQIKTSTVLTRMGRSDRCGDYVLRPNSSTHILSCHLHIS